MAESRARTNYEMVNEISAGRRFLRMTSNLYHEIADLNQRITAAETLLASISPGMPQTMMFAVICRAREGLAMGWPDRAGDSELFDRISAHIEHDYTDDIAIKNICAQTDKQLAALRRIVEFADINPFMTLGHLIEHVVPEARFSLGTPQQEHKG